MGTVLVTGGAGYVGSHVVWALYRAGEKIVVMDNLSTGNIQLLPPFDERMMFQQHDIADSSFIYEICDRYKVTDLIHMAAKTSVPESMAIPRTYIEHNYEYSSGVFEQALEGGVKNIVFSSTAAVYGNVGHAMPHAVPESMICHPTNAYGRSKLMTEWLLDAMSRQHEAMKFVALRYFNVAGADPELRTGCIAGESLFKKLAYCVVTGQEFPMYGDGHAIRDFVHVSDVAQAHVDALKFMRNTPQLKRATFNVGYGTGYTVKRVADQFNKSMQGTLKVLKQPPRAGDVPEMVADSRRIQEIVGWRPRYNLLETMVNTALDWENKWRKLND